MSAEAPLPAGWTRCSLGECLKGPPRNGYSPKEVPNWTGRVMLGLGCLSPSGFQPSQIKNAPAGDAGVDAALLRDGDLLVSRSNTRELVALPGIFRDVGVPCSYPDLMMRLESNTRTTNEFLALVLRSPRMRRKVMRVAAGTSGSMVKVSAATIVALSMRLPPPPEQHAILSIARSIDDAIARTEAVIEKKLALRSGLRDELIHGHSADTAWHEQPLGRVVPSVQYGVSVSLSDEGGVPVLRMNNLQGGRFNVRELRYSNAPEARALLLREGDVLFNRTNSLEHVGRTSLWRSELPVASFASYCVRLDVDRQQIDPAYLVEFMNLRETQLAIKRIATPAIQQVNVNPTRLRQSLLVRHPRSLAEQRRIVDILDAHDARIRAERAERDKLVALKRGLLDDLLTGRVRVSAAAPAAP